MDIELPLAADKRVRLVVSGPVYSPAGGTVLNDPDLDESQGRSSTLAGSGSNAVLFDLRCYDAKGNPVKVSYLTTFVSRSAVAWHVLIG